MRKQVVAIVGRPNVGKSTLFNRLCRKRSAIVDFESGITRDRKYEDVEWNGKVFSVVDTGGIVADSTESMDQLIRYQAAIAIEEADLILFVVDAKTSITDLDSAIAKILHPHREKVILVVNKVDNEKDEFDLFEFLQLGFGEAFPISASQGRNTGKFLDVLMGHIPAQEICEEEEDKIKIAIVGKPNVGKSSIVNKLLGNEQVIVSEVPGTTRDSIDTDLRFKGKKLTIIDTAGLRRKARVKYGVEYFSSMRTLETVDRADVVVLVLAADEEISNQEQRIASYARRKFKDLIIVVNKWDLPEDKDNSTVGKFVTTVREELSFIDYAPILFISALTGQRVQKILEMVLEVDEASHVRIPTAQLNEFRESFINKHAPSHHTGRHIKLKYMTQVEMHPPTFLIFCNAPRLLSEAYKRYIHNQIRDKFKFKGATIRIIFKGKDPDEPDIEY
jgi:GTPase